MTSIKNGLISIFNFFFVTALSHCHLVGVDHGVEEVVTDVIKGVGRHVQAGDNVISLSIFVTT